MQEVVSHMASKMAQIIADELQRINTIQQSQKLHQTRIYKIVVITFDLTSWTSSILRCGRMTRPPTRFPLGLEIKTSK